MDRTMKSCLPSHWSFVHNIGVGAVARIILGWDGQGPKVNVLHVSDQLIACSVEQDMHNFMFTVVCCSNHAVSRRHLWNELRSIHGSIGSNRWVIVGDFNIVRKQSERSIANNFDIAAADEFNSCLEDIDMEDLNSTGFFFTWSNKRGGLGNVRSGIDQAVVNSLWQNKYFESEAVVLAPGMSDHYPIIASVRPRMGRRKPCGFFYFWMSHGKFSVVLLQAWSKEFNASPMYKLYKKLRELKSLLKSFNTEFYSDIQKRVLNAQEELTSIQEQCAALPCDIDLHNKEKDYLVKYYELSAAEEAFNW